MNKEFFAIIGAIGVIILAVVFWPFITFWLGYFTGWLTKITVGAKVCSALNATLGTSFTPEVLPWVGAALGWIGSFFKTVNTNTTYKSKY